MFPVPEPAGDIAVQVKAALDEAHPKRACFLVADDWRLAPLHAGAFVEVRPEGRLITLDKALTLYFRHAPREVDAFDATMAEILGYPEAKPDVAAGCDGRPIANARAVQARDKDGWVITEAFTSPKWLGITQAELQKHVPPGGTLVVLTPIEAIGRRLLLREAGQ